MAWTSWSIHREDILLLRALQGIHHDQGFYIDVGANDPTFGSDTKLFYDSGWRGMNVEPSPHWFKKLVEQRPRDVNIHAAASDEAGIITLYDHPEGGLGTTNEEFADRHVDDWNIAKRAIEVPAYTLAWLCERYIKQKTVHFLKIDVEGHEERVIRGMNFNTCRPWILCVEAVEPMKVHIPTHEPWEHLLLASGYRFMLFDGLNRWYVAEEHPERFDAFSYPTDDFLHWTYSSRIAELETRVRDLECGVEANRAGGAETPTQIGNPDIPVEWQAKADAATERRKRLASFGPHAKGILASTDNGLMVVDAEDGSVSAALLAGGTYADHEYAMARSLITTDGTVLVVGAHIGSHVVRLAKHCRELIAVEANPRTFAFLEANIRLQGCDNVRLLNLAAGEKNGTIEFLMNRDNSGGSKRQPVNAQFYYIYDQPDAIEVECRKLDELLPKDTHFDLVFMDIEGSEYFALQGMQSILARTKAASVEFLTHAIRDVAAADIDHFAALLVPHFNWMIVPERREFVPKSAMTEYILEMYATGQNYDCVYFFKNLDLECLAVLGLPDPRVN